MTEPYVLRCGTGQRLNQHCEMRFNNEHKVHHNGLLNPYKQYFCTTHIEGYIERPVQIEVRAIWPDGKVTETVEELNQP